MQGLDNRLNLHHRRLHFRHRHRRPHARHRTLGSGHLRRLHAASASQHPYHHRQHQGQHAPKQKLCQAHESQPQHLAHQQLERLHRRNHHLDNPIRLLLDDPAHDLASVNEDETVNQKAEHIGHNALDFRIRTLARHHVLRNHIHLGIIDILEQSWIQIALPLHQGHP